MIDSECKSLGDALADLDRIAPGVPLLALGQTVFWDEPMKAGVAQKLRRTGSTRRFVAGVHDTDYFAKLPSAKGGKGKFRALPHNDTTTRGLWSAAGEFSALFGSETVVTRDTLAAAGLRLERVSEARPGFLDEVTEAWGWRGIVALDDWVPVTAELPLKGLFPELQATFDWALNASLASLAGEGRAIAQALADELRGTMCDLAEEPGQSLARYYQKLLPVMYEFGANAPVDIDTTTTSDLLRFNTQTCDQPRFEILDLFVNEATRRVAQEAYDAAIQGAPGLYELGRFGTGSIPFDLVIPGEGRGTIRLGKRGAVIMTRRPQFLSFKKPLTSVRELAALVQAKFGPDCVLVGKAVALIGMLGREFCFVFHEGASGYVKHSRRLHEILAERGMPLTIHPILRVRYDAWEALRVCCSWLRLPEPFQRAFGTEELCAPSFADRWREVGDEQRELLRQLGRLRRPIELIRFLDQTLGGSWHRLAEEYEGLHERLATLERDLATVREERDTFYDQLRALRRDRVEAERRKGEQFRAAIFEREPSEAETAERQRLTEAVEAVEHRANEVRLQMRAARKRQVDLVSDPDVRRVHERRQAIELEAELKRARLIRSATISSKGLASATLRPSAWWFRLLCPDGLWFRETVESAECYLEPLS